MANIELDGANKKIKVDSGDLTLDVPGDIVLDADGANVTFKDGGTSILDVSNSSSDVVLQPQVDAKDIIFKQYDGTTVATVEDNATFNIPASKLAIGGTAVTSTAAELNILDGVTATATELNLIDGVTATTAELNILDGVTSTAAELNIVDGNTSATSTTIADADRVVLNDNGTMVQAAVTDLKTYIGGTHVQIAQSTFSTSTDVSFTSIQQSTYNNYLVKIESLYASADNTSLYGRIYLSSGEITSSLYDYAVREYRSDDTLSSTQNQNGAFMRFNHRSLDDNAAHPFFANIYIGGVKNGERCQFFGQHGFSSSDSDNPSVAGFSSAHYTSSQEITGFKFYPDANNITGKITIFGIKT